MSLAHDVGFDPTRPLPSCLLEGRTIGPADVRERPKAPPLVAIKCPIYEKCRIEGECTAAGYCLDAQKAKEQLAALEKALFRDRLNEIAKLVRALTYGEMMELAEAVWKTKPESDITQDALPMMLHKWSGSR